MKLLSIFRKSRPTTISEGDFIGLSGRVEEAEKALIQIIDDQATINTAINRIERKQNRWIELINSSELSKPLALANTGGLIAPPGNGQPGASASPGEPTEE